MPTLDKKTKDVAPKPDEFVWFKSKRFWLGLAGVGCIALGGPVPACLSLIGV